MRVRIHRCRETFRRKASRSSDFFAGPLPELSPKSSRSARGGSETAESASSQPQGLPGLPSLTATLRDVPGGRVRERRPDARVAPPPGRPEVCRKNRDGLTGRFFGGRVRCRTAKGAFRYRQEDEIVTLRTPFRLAAGAGLWLAAAAAAETP